jgi:hypothetical protein
MGVCGSKGYQFESRSDFQYLGMSKAEWSELQVAFNGIKKQTKNKKGVEMSKFIENIDIDLISFEINGVKVLYRKFFAKVFARFPPALDFHDFVVALWDYCTLDTDRLSNILVLLFSI